MGKGGFKCLQASWRPHVGSSQVPQNLFLCFRLQGVELLTQVAIKQILRSGQVIKEGKFAVQIKAQAKPLATKKAFPSPSDTKTPLSEPEKCSKLLITYSFVLHPERSQVISNSALRDYSSP